LNRSKRFIGRREISEGCAHAACCVLACFAAATEMAYKRKIEIAIEDRDLDL
jgi:hypothetical protein